MPTVYILVAKGQPMIPLKYLNIWWRISKPDAEKTGAWWENTAPVVK